MTYSSMFNRALAERVLVFLAVSGIYICAR